MEGNEMSDNIPTPIFIWLLFFLLIVFGIFLGGFAGNSKIEKQAIQAGVAYYTNDASGAVQFKWKECK